MARAIVAVGMALVAMLALACGGGPATPTPTATPTTVTPAPTVTPTPSPMATATPSATPTATPTATPSPTPTAPPPPTPFPTPTGPAVAVTGPLVVLSERLGEGDWEGADATRRWVETRRAYVYDVGTEKYWAAFDYRHAGTYYGTHFSAVQLAGTKLIVWSDGQVRRVGLNGYTEAILFEHDWIRTVEASPDGTKVALTYGVPRDEEVVPRSLLVLDIATGAELLRIRYDDALLEPLREAAPNVEFFSLGDWHADSGSLSLIAARSACRWCYPPDRAAIVSLDGGMRMLPEGWLLSPDLRHALRLGEIAGHREGQHGGPFYVREGFDVLDLESGEVWTVAAEEGGGLIVREWGPSAGWWQERSWWQEPSYIRFEELAAEPEWRDKPPREGEWRILDAATRTILPKTEGLMREIRGPVRRTCRAGPEPCELWYDERLVWEGAGEWLFWHGLVNLTGETALRGITLREHAQDSLPPAAPARVEMVGPLLIYEVRGRDERNLVDRFEGWLRTWWVMAYDEGTGRSWKFAERRGPRPTGLDHSSPLQKAHMGVVMGVGTSWWDAGPAVYVGLTGQRTVLLDRRESTWEFQVSPDGKKVAAFRIGEGVRILDLSGNELFFHDEKKGSDFVADILDYSDEYLGPGLLSAVWSEESDRIAVWYGSPEGGHATMIVVKPNGSLENVCTTIHHNCPLSPDFRFIAWSRYEEIRESGEQEWHLDIFEFDTDQLLYTLEIDTSVDWRNWEWASATRFAWSHDFWFYWQRPEWDAERAEVSVIDVETGEIEVMDSAEYLARFHPPPRATTDCSPNPAHACRILLDGEVVGEGRWPSIVGFIDIGQPPPAP